MEVWAVILSLVLLGVAVKYILTDKWWGKIIFNLLFAFAILLIVNYAAAACGFHVPINLVNVLLIAILGLPGAGIICILNFLLA